MTWSLSQVQFRPLLQAKDGLFFLQFRQMLLEKDVDEQFFIKCGQEKPQYCDLNNALSVQSVERSLRKWLQSQSDSNVQIMEVLPDYFDDTHEYVSEFAIECKVNS
jgi:hypothetical protein